MFSRIEDYALIVDCETAALVSKDGSIDWLCWPRFDSGAWLAARTMGRCGISPSAARADANVQLGRGYRRDTLILETECTAGVSGAVVAIDFMSLRGGRVLGRISCVWSLATAAPMSAELIVRFGYGGWVPWVTRYQ